VLSKRTAGLRAQQVEENGVSFYSLYKHFPFELLEISEPDTGLWVCSYKRKYQIKSNSTLPQNMLPALKKIAGLTIIPPYCDIDF
jgi:hypothetical protein